MASGKRNKWTWKSIAGTVAAGVLLVGAAVWGYRTYTEGSGDSR